MTRIERNQSALTGSLVADAAALGLHWLYDADHLQAIAGTNPEFRKPNPNDFAGVEGYFAHGGKQPGDNSQYGATLQIMLDALAAHQGMFTEEEFQNRYQHWFGPGGQWQGYIDHPTKGTLANLAQGTTEPSGADDRQLPALSTLPAVLARVRNPAELPNLIGRSVRLTNNNDFAVEVARHAGLLLYQVLEGRTLEQGLELTGPLPGALNATFEKVRYSQDSDPAVLGGLSGRACLLEQGYPLLLGLLFHTHTFSDATRFNILAGGDSCGRSILLGALAGALYGIGGEKGIPLGWIARLNVPHKVFDAIDVLSHRP